MSYYEKYLKYKNKYLNLSNKQNNFNIQQGGAINIQNGNINTDITNMVSLFALRRNKFSSYRILNEINLTNENHSVELQVDNGFITVDFNPTSNEITSTIRPNNNSIYTSELNLNNKTKKFIIIRRTDTEIYQFTITANYETGLNQTNYIETTTPANFSITINKNGQTDLFEGEVTIRLEVSPTCNFDFTINKINNENCSFKFITNSVESFFLKDFNFQESYDRMKESRYNACIESTLLNKHIYNTLYTNESLNNSAQLLNTLNRYGGILEEILKYKYTNNTNIRNICSNENERKKILKNVMKRINTTFKEDEFLIKNSSDRFITLTQLNLNSVIDNSDFKIVFDTGNSSVTTIGIDLVAALGLREKHIFDTKSFGVTGHSSINNTYVDVELKMNPNNTNISLESDKIYKFKAMVTHNSLKNTLLLGQSAEGLKSFFDNSYCVGFNFLRQKSDQEMNEIKEQLNIFLRNIFEILCITVYLFLSAKYNTIDVRLLNTFTKQIVIRIFREAQENNNTGLPFDPHFSITTLLSSLKDFDENLDSFNFNVRNDNKVSRMLPHNEQRYRDYIVQLLDKCDFISNANITGSINRLLDSTLTFNIDTTLIINHGELDINANHNDSNPTNKTTFDLNANGIYILILRLISIIDIFIKIKYNTNIYITPGSSDIKRRIIKITKIIKK